MMSPEKNKNADLVLSLLEDICYAGNTESACPYLPEKSSRMLFLNGESLGSLYRILMDEGYRRYGRYVYRTDCSACSECRVIRIPVSEFKMSPSQRRVWKKGKKKFTHKIAAPEKTAGKEEMYRNYLKSQHGTFLESESDNDYDFFFTETFLGENTKELQLYFENRLSAVGIMDFSGDAVSSVYFYFDEAVARFSPGTYSVLLEIEIARELGMKYYYPGFYISGAKTMRYKRNFKPCYIRDVSSGEWIIHADNGPE